MPDVHHAQHVDDNHRDAENNEKRGVNVEAEQNACDKKHGAERERQIHEKITPNGEVLIVEDVEDARNRRGINQRAIMFVILEECACNFGTSGADVLAGRHPKRMRFIEVQLNKTPRSALTTHKTHRREFMSTSPCPRLFRMDLSRSATCTERRDNLRDDSNRGTDAIDCRESCERYSSLFHWHFSSRQ